jgi:hypothetical protein
MSFVFNHLYTATVIGPGYGSGTAADGSLIDPVALTYAPDVETSTVYLTYTYTSQPFTVPFSLRPATPSDTSVQVPVSNADFDVYLLKMTGATPGVVSQDDPIVGVHKLAPGESITVAPDPTASTWYSALAVKKGTSVSELTAIPDIPHVTPPPPIDPGGDGGGDGDGGDGDGGDGGGDGGTGGGGDGGTGGGTGGGFGPRNGELEQQWEAFSTIVGDIPYVGTAMNLINVAVDGGQLGAAIFNGDWADARDEVGDLAGDFAGAVGGLIPIPGAGSLIGGAVAGAVTGGLDKLFG